MAKVMVSIQQIFSRNILFTLGLLTILACATSCKTNDSIIVDTSTPLPSSTPTLTPSSTPTPTATPQPLGGSGKFIMKLDQSIIPDEFDSQISSNWFSASPDGSNLTPIDLEIWSLSQDGKRALTYNSEKKVSLTNMDDFTSIPLEDTVDYNISDFSNSYSHKTALWLPNGNIILLAREKINDQRLSAYIVTPDGHLNRWDILSQVLTKEAGLSFLSPNGKNLYWTDESGGLFTRKLYMNSLDGLEFKKISLQGTGIQDIYMSPSGQYIVDIGFTGNFLDCYVYNVVDETDVKIRTEDGNPVEDYCFGKNHWSPTEDFLFGVSSIYNVSDQKIIPTNSTGNTCPSIEWTPDGKSLLLYNCGSNQGSYDKGTYDYYQPNGSELVNIADGTRIKYLNTGLCDAAISPDSKWALFYNCTDEVKSVLPQSLLINLETKEMTPIFQEIHSKSNESPSDDGQFSQRLWSVYWIP